ncbi:hypothetical protein A3H75_00280 [Candidatus Uhrbacteria bacterium RIFCSPLOWO2_02_FULL_51_9]|uniref:DUF5658 domain-containing protein n=1 Tax=Candidatus Uhrbacteria bacterium RIFCSPLOWO2_02_FULL_51_9 TaxID=1802410 RepID=A0A1F7VGP1_9BACT|nr:MAG: hypothetical protein A3H75_00280 [Candidatus Uhrbacteria bacterium RIFCSPLOWO2_02_FULL_51_9]
MSTIAVRELVREKMVWMPGALALFLNLAAWIYVAAKISPSEDLFILHYNIHFGVDFLGEWFLAFVPPLVGILFMMANSVLVWWFWMRLRVLSLIVIAATVVLQGTLLGVAVLLVALNT